jgi:hypothetical protein
LEEVAVRTGHEVLIDFDDNISMNAADPRGILDHQFRPHTIHPLNIIILFLFIKSSPEGKHGTFLINLTSNNNLKRYFRILIQGITKGGSITVPSTSCLTALESAV